MRYNTLSLMISLFTVKAALILSHVCIHSNKNFYLEIICNLMLYLEALHLALVDIRILYVETKQGLSLPIKTRVLFCKRKRNCFAQQKQSVPMSINGFVEMTIFCV